MRKSTRLTLLRGGDAEAVDWAARLDELERKLERLRALYESYFMGVERAAPSTARRELNRLMLEGQQSSISNAGLRFRFQSLMQKWVLYTTYWNRVLREIEAGTYRRDVARARRHMAAKGAPLSEEDARAMGLSRAAARRAGAAAQATSASAGPAPSADVSEREVRALYDKYAAHFARRAEPVPLTYDDLRARVLTAAPKLLAQPGARAVAWDLVEEGGRLRVRGRVVTES